MITKVLLLTLISIVFYFIIQSIKDGFQNAKCAFKYSGTNYNDCIESCNGFDRNLCSGEKCREICNLSTECNDKTSNNCSLKTCAWSRSKNMCEVPGTKYYRKDDDNIIYRNNILFSNIDEEDGNYKIVRKPTKFKDAIQMYRFKGASYSKNQGFNNSFIYVSDFYGEGLMATFFFEFIDNLDSSGVIPLLTSQNWNVSLVKQGQNNFVVRILSEKFGRLAADETFKKTIEPGFLYSFGIVIKNDKASIVILNTGDTDIEITDENTVLEIDNFIYGRTPFILVGTNLERNSFFDGFIGEFTITRDATDTIDLKANSYVFSPKQIEAIKLDVRSGDTSLLTIQDVSVPSKIDFLGKKQKNKLTLIWHRPEVGSTFLEYYIIVIKNIVNNTRYYLFIENNKCRDCKYTIPNLELDTEYNVGITGFNSNGLGKELDYLSVTLKSITTPIEEKTLLVNTPDKISCNPDGTYTIGKDCDAMKVERISSILTDEEYFDILSQLKEKINLNMSMSFKI